MWGLVFYLEQELHTFPEHLRSPPVFSGVRVTRSLVLYVCLVDHCLSFCTFSFGHCVVCSSSIYRLWLPLWYLPTFGHCVVCSSSIYGFWLALWYLLTFGYWVVCSSSIYGFWLPLWYIPTFGHCVVCSSSIYGFWLPLWYLPTFGHCVVCSSSIYGLWLPLWYLPTFGHCVVFSSSIYGFWLPLWYLRYTDSDCPFGILDIRILITSLWYLQTRLTHLWLKTYIGLFCVSFGISIKYEELDLTSLYWNHNYTSVITNSVILLGLSNSSRNNRRSAYIWVPNMLLFSPTFCFILTCQTSYSGFTRKPLTSRFSIQMMSFR